MLKSRNVLVVQVREDDVRLLCGRLGLTGFAFADARAIPGDVRRRVGDPAFVESLSREVEKFSLHNSLRNPLVVVGLHRKLFIWKQFRVPPVPPENLEQLIDFEVDKHLPVSREEMLYRSHPLELTPDGWNISLAGTRRDLVKIVETALEPLGLRVETVVCDLWGLVYFLRNGRYDFGQSESLIVTAGGAGMEATLLRAGVPRAFFSRNFSPLEAGEAESAGDQLATRAAELGDAVRAALAALAVPERPLKNGFVFADGISGDLLLPRLEGMPVGSWTVIKSLDLPFLQGRDEYRGLDNLAATWGLAAGAEELQGGTANVLHRPKVRRAPQKVSWRITAALMVLLLLAAGAFYGSQLYVSQRRLAAVDREIGRLKVKVQEVKRLDATIKSREDQARVLEKVMARRVRVSEILKELTVNIPATAYLEQLSLKENGNVELVGMADAASELISKLEASPLFKNVAFDGSITQARGQEKERFKIKMSLE